MRVKNITFAGMFLIAAIMIISLASAEIMISQPKSIYSAGDELSLEIKLDAIQSGYLNVDLNCNSATANLYRNVPESKTISITRKLTQEYIGTITGNCFVSASYDVATSNSQTFEISNSLEVSIQTLNMSYEAGKPITIKGNVYKKNNILAGQNYPAFAEILIEGINKKESVKDGQFSVEFVTPENMKAGSYLLEARVYENDEKENVLSSGSANTNLVIFQKPARIDIALGKTQIISGENISFVAFLYDRAGDEVNDKILVKIANQNNQEIYRGYIDSNQEALIQTATTELLGDLKITVVKDDITSEKIAQISELKKISAKIEGNILTIENIGNVPYSGIVQALIGEQIINQEVSLNLGEKRMFKLSAPDGSYNIELKDTDMILSQSSIPLTGKAISMKDVSGRIGNIWMNYPVMWIFIGFIAVMLLYLRIRKHKQKKKFYSPSNKDINTLKEIKRKGGIEVVKPMEVYDNIIAGENARKAEQVLTLHGNKQPASVVAIKIKNNLAGIAKQNFEKALEYAYRKKAVSYSSGNYVLLIFSPLITKTMQNDETAVKAAIEFDTWLRDHNRRFKNDIIEYGIGVNTGEIVNKIEGKILQFASIDKTIINAKRIADVSRDEVLLSRETHEKTMNNIRAEKAVSGAMDLFRIKRVVDTEKSKKFIEEFMKRN